MMTEMQVLERLKTTIVSQLNAHLESSDGVLPEEINAQNVMVTAKESADGSSVLQYSAIGISAFSLNCTGHHRDRGSRQERHNRQDRSQGSRQEVLHPLRRLLKRRRISNGLCEHPLSCHVFLSLEEVTQGIDEWRFHWKRSSGNAASDSDWNASPRAIGHKTIDIDSSDCPGRTVFSCEVDFDGLDL